jgi:hypothetical protein
VAHWRLLGGLVDVPAELEPRAVAGLRGDLAADLDAVVVLGGADLARAVRGALLAGPETAGAVAGPGGAVASAGAVGSAGAGGAPPAGPPPAGPPPLYASSLIGPAFEGERRVPELDGVRLMQMPWLVWPDHPAVMAYPRLGGQLANVELQRLYALGIDASASRARWPRAARASRSTA